MSYELAIHPDAEKEWSSLDNSIKSRFKKKLKNERLIAPRVEKDSLKNLQNCYKIKITTPQFRLVYHVNDTDSIVTILCVTTRDEVYEELKARDKNI